MEEKSSNPGTERKKTLRLADVLALFTTHNRDCWQAAHQL
jgi:hypothetical protein